MLKQTSIPLVRICMNAEANIIPLVYILISIAFYPLDSLLN